MGAISELRVITWKSGFGYRCALQGGIPIPLWRWLVVGSEMSVPEKVDNPWLPRLVMATSTHDVMTGRYTIE